MTRPSSSTIRSASLSVVWAMPSLERIDRSGAALAGFSQAATRQHKYSSTLNEGDTAAALMKALAHCN